MDELLSEFLTECFENMAVLDSELVRLERNPNDLDLIGSIFRIVHTIKGTCGFLGLPRLEAVAHASENVLGKFREGSMPVTPTAVTLILSALDRIKELLETLAAEQKEPPGDDNELIARLNAMAVGDTVPDAETSPMEASPPSPAAARKAVEPEAPAPDPAPVATDPAPAPVVPSAEAEIREPAKEAAVAKPSTEATPQSNGSGKSMASQTLRVPVDLLETLMTLVGELVLTRNQLLQMIRNSSDNTFNTSLQRLSHITSELQEGVMKTRMQPIGNAWGKLPRIVRDLSVDLNKQIELRMLGAETELDRQVLELIKDPLTHMVRNSADHGLELPADRRAAGKPEQGTITLNAFHEGGHIIIEIKDDGRGLDVNRIAAKALASGLCSESELAAMKPQQIMQFIFKAGFSTAAAVTSVSGRGVGMDVVRSNIEKIGGSIELSSEHGKGSTFAIKIPLTLAIVSALIVEAGGERFAIPQIGVVELVRTTKTSEHKIEVINGSAILRLREQLLPLISLANLLGCNERGIETWSQDAHVVVSQVGANVFGLIVDQVYDTEEIVVKPVAPILRDLNIYSGNTILGDGSVVMILDLNGVTNTLNASGNTALKDNNAKLDDDVDLTSLLIFKAGHGGPKAVPLALITRLEEISPDKIEWSGSRTVTQYRDHLMPLVDISGNPVKDITTSHPVLVFSDANHNMGLVVEQIIDITYSKVELDITSSKDNLVGTAVINNNSTDFLDVSYFVNHVFGGWFAEHHQESFEDEKTSKHVLLVDDSSFFRNLLTPLLASSEYIVRTASCPQQALTLRDQGQMFDIIISDIEMPGMDGFAFAAACRQAGSWQDTPIIALTSHMTPKDIKRGQEVGFTDYVGKLDRQTLLAALASVDKAVSDKAV